MSVRSRFNRVNGLACVLFLAVIPLAAIGYPVVAATSAFMAIGTYLYCVVTTKCPRCGTRLLLKSKGPLDSHASFPHTCPTFGLDTTENWVGEHSAN